MYSNFAKHSFLVMAFRAALLLYDFSVLHMVDDTEDETRESRDNASDDDIERRRFVDDIAERRSVAVTHLRPSVALCFTKAAKRSWNRKLTRNRRRIGSLSQDLFVPPASAFTSKSPCFARMKSKTPEKAAPIPIAALLGLDVNPSVKYPRWRSVSWRK
jgi:hypothetical protein